MKESLRNLGDDFSGNPTHAHGDLVSVLLAIGDDKNAIAIAQQRCGNNPDETASSYFVCDGCEFHMPIFNASLCRYCTNLIGFCAPCMELLKASSLRIKVCSPKHDWVLIPHWKEKSKANSLLMDSICILRIGRDS